MSRQRIGSSERKTLALAKAVAEKREADALRLAKEILRKEKARAELTSSQTDT